MDYKRFRNFMVWMDGGSFFAIVFSVLFNLFIIPLFYWDHRYQHDWFHNLRAWMRKYGAVGRFAASLIDTTNRCDSPPSETIVFLLGIAVYSIVWFTFSFVFVAFAFLIAATETWKDNAKI